MLFRQLIASRRLIHSAQIFISGDSAGGNLALALLSHMLHPHPDLEDKLRIKLPSPLAGAILTSPWVKFPTDDSSVERNEGSDFICKGAVNRWSTAFLGTYRS
jgi:acetyl esterase/lipase